MRYLDQLRSTCERLAQLSESRLLAQEQQYRQVLERLTDRPVPRVQPRAWADQLWVVGREVQEAPEDLCQALIQLRRCFDLVP